MVMSSYIVRRQTKYKPAMTNYIWITLVLASFFFMVFGISYHLVISF